MGRPWKPRLYPDPDLPERVQVRVMADRLGLTRAAVVEKLLRFWVAAQVRADPGGLLAGRPASWVDHLVECPGFADAMAAVLWLVVTADGVRVPGFDRFVSKAAVRRIEDTRRKRLARGSSADNTADNTAECPENVRSIVRTTPITIGTNGANGHASPQDRKKRKSPQPRKPRAHEVTDARFWKFWRAYPKQWNQPAAYAEWVRLNPDDGLVDTIVAAVESAKKSEQWSKNDGAYIPLPANYLSGRRWQDRVEHGGVVRPTGRYYSGKQYVGQPAYVPKVRPGGAPPVEAGPPLFGAQAPGPRGDPPAPGAHPQRPDDR